MAPALLGLPQMVLLDRGALVPGVHVGELAVTVKTPLVKPDDTFN